MEKIDNIIRDWFYELPNGYAEHPYSQKELSILDEVLAKYDTPLNEIDQLDQAFLAAKPVKEAVEDSKFIPYMSDILSTKAGIQKKLIDITVNVYNNLSNAEKETFQKKFRTQSISNFIGGGYKPFLKFFDILGDVKGLGRGEIQVLLAVKDSSTGGTKEHDIVMDNGQYEVKELTKNADFDPAKFGDVNRHSNLTLPIRDFYEFVVGPYEIFQDDGGFPNRVKSMFDDKSHDKIDQLFKIFDDFFTYKRGRTSNSAAQVSQFREISGIPLENIYRGFLAFNKLFESPFDADVKDTRLALKGDTTGTYWVSDDDAEKISQAAGEDEPVSIDIGEPIDNENNSIVIWFKRLERSEFVKNPQNMIVAGREIVDEFFEGVLGIIYYEQGTPVPHMAIPDDFAIQKITRSHYRIAYKPKIDASNYTFVRDQKGK